MNQSPWTSEQQAALLDLMSKHGSLSILIHEAAKVTGRSEKSVLRRLQKIGFMNRHGTTFKAKAGHVSN